MINNNGNNNNTNNGSNNNSNSAITFQTWTDLLTQTKERFVKYVCCAMTLKDLFWYILRSTKHNAGKKYPLSFCSYEYGDRFKVCQNLAENKKRFH